MTSTTLVELRRIEFSLEAVAECILEADRDLGGKLWRATPHTVRLVRAPALAVTLTVTKPGESEITEVSWSGPQLAAAMIRLCGRLRIPLQRLSSKRVEAGERGLTLVTESSLRLPRTLGLEFKVVPSPPLPAHSDSAVPAEPSESREAAAPAAAPA